MAQTNDILTQAKALADNAMKPAAIVAALKTAGATQIQSIWALRVLGYSLAEADEMVLYHPDWDQQRVLTEQLRDEFWRAMEQDADRIEYGPDGQASYIFDVAENEQGSNHES